MTEGEHVVQVLDKPAAAGVRTKLALDSLIGRAEKLLRSSGHIGLRAVRCDYSEGTLVLRGRVPTYYLKQLAQQVLLANQDLGSFCNEIEVAAYIPDTSYPCIWG